MMYHPYSLYNTINYKNTGFVASYGFLSLSNKKFGYIFLTALSSVILHRKEF